MSADRLAARRVPKEALRDRTGVVIRQARKAQRLTLRDLAAICEVDYTTIKAITEAIGKHMAGAA
ncbi:MULTISPECIES: hypothetical protein [unclassified Nocardioides]|uniref:hypothetical protein n=1 Tax=unclassified Nocardioides TaxID=2615069 RepID=UPI000056F621|nr:MULTISPECIES: hypothetical protein [unclassified Nocardioides]ABL80089.1 hypothetical protein Noca_0547 [Nocardioides sp. JS614]